jgi:hypothetical protein
LDWNEVGLDWIGARVPVLGSPCITCGEYFLSICGLCFNDHLFFSRDIAFDIHAFPRVKTSGLVCRMMILEMV